MKRNKLKLSLCCFLIAVSHIFAHGILIPQKPSLPPLSLKNEDIKIKIRDNVSHTSISQVFYNAGHQPLEAIFIFPIPDGANIDSFSLMMNGKMVEGEVLEKDKARQIYTSIVRRMKDPGLIEQFGNNLFKARIFPVPARGDQKVEISYSQILKPDNGLVEYMFPLKQSNQRLRLTGNFTIYIDLESKHPLKNIYSPSHKVDIVRKGEKKALISFEQRQLALNKNFQLFYSETDKAVEMNFISYRKLNSDGTFMMMLAPPFEIDEKDILPKDVCFIIDSSGSMNGKKMEQAKDALKYCVNKLNSKDRFNIIRFSTGVSEFKESLIEASGDNKASAAEFIKDLSARGGTDINSALEKALAMRTENKRPYMVVFLTDGHPTIGTTDQNDIIKNIKKSNVGDSRIFAFGLGHDLNTHLLDEIAEVSRASNQYVSENENIEVKVSSFFDRVSSPVLTNLKLNIKGVEVDDIYPTNLPDLFKGQPLIILGRYKKPGHAAVTLKGNFQNKEKEFVYEASFSENDTEHPFIAGLWAKRKVAYLLHNIRVNGEKKELVDEVTRLAQNYGIVTPYTSYLVIEDQQPGRPTGPPMHPEARRELKKMDVVDDALEADVAEESKDQAVRDNATQYRQWEGGMKEKSGASSVAASKNLNNMKSEAKTDTAVNRYRKPVHIGNRTFVYQETVWNDTSWNPEKSKPVVVKYLSDAWFDLLSAKPELKKMFSLGEQVLVNLENGNSILVSTKKGKENLSKDEIKKLLQ